MKKENLLIIVTIAILIYAGLLLGSIKQNQENQEKVLINDAGRLYPTYVKEIVKENQVEGIQEVVKQAREENLKVSIAGRRHSQGGHTFYEDAVVLEMTEFNEIINLDKENKIITVQSGTTWEQIQEFINPLDLSIKTMQSSNIFTIGGSMSANIHGRDLEKTLIIETIQSFRLLLSNGTIVNVNRTENPELFSLVIGGYGLFGVILDVDIELTDNIVLEKESVIMDYKEFLGYFENNIKDNPEAELFIARPSIAPSTLLKEVVVQTWKKTDKTEEGIFELGEEENVLRDKFFFGLSRKFEWGKELRWYFQKKLTSKPGETELVSKINAMRPPTAPLKFFVEYSSPSDTDLIQEYFIPTRNFVSFMDGAKEIIKEENINFLSSTVRYVKQNNESFLSYTPNEDSFGIILFANYKLSKKGQEDAERAIQKLVDLALENDGTYYLTYQLYPTQEQIKRSYPNIDEFLKKKKEYDPNELFMNKFYEKYALGIEPKWRN